MRRQSEAAQAVPERVETRGFPSCVHPQLPREFRQHVTGFLDGLISHYVLNDGNLVVSHAGIKADYQGRSSARVRDFCLYGETTGETDELGLPVRSNWAVGYRGSAMVVYGHTEVEDPAWPNLTINIDTGCVFGGKLTTLRYPERELVSVPAARIHYVPGETPGQGRTARRHQLCARCGVGEYP